MSYIQGLVNKKLLQFNMYAELVTIPANSLRITKTKVKIEVSN